MKNSCFVLCALVLFHSFGIELKAQQQITVRPQPAEIEKKVEKLDPSVKEEITERLGDLQKLARLPEPIDPSEHSNGCGPAWLPGFPHLINQQTFKGKDSQTNVTTSFKVNFKPACDLHDAGYAGLIVINRFGASPWDYSTRSKESVDYKFFIDLSKICDQTIPASNKEALEKCKWTKLGAWGYHYAVQKAGYFTFDCNPTLPGFPWKQPCTRAYADPKNLKKNSATADTEAAAQR